MDKLGGNSYKSHALKLKACLYKKKSHTQSTSVEATPENHYLYDTIGYSGMLTLSNHFNTVGKTMIKRNCYIVPYI